MKPFLNYLKDLMENIDLPILFGVITALIRAMREKLSFKKTVTNLVLAGLICYGGVALVTKFLPDVSPRVYTLVGVGIGYFMKEILDLITDLFPLFKEKIEKELGINDTTEDIE